MRTVINRTPREILRFCFFAGRFAPAQNGQFGFGANPAGTLGGLAGDTQNAANGASAGANDLFMQWLLSRQAGG